MKKDRRSIWHIGYTSFKKCCNTRPVTETLRTLRLLCDSASTLFSPQSAQRRRRERKEVHTAPELPTYLFTDKETHFIGGWECHSSQIDYRWIVWLTDCWIVGFPQFENIQLFVEHLTIKLSQKPRSILRPPGILPPNHKHFLQKNERQTRGQKKNWNSNESEYFS